MNAFTINSSSAVVVLLVNAVIISAVTDIASQTRHVSDVRHRERRRIPDNMFQLKEMMTTTEESDIGREDDVLAIPIDDFRDYWYGRRLTKRSLSSKVYVPVQKRSHYQPWGGKRFLIEEGSNGMVRGFNPNGGRKRSAPNPRQRSPGNDGDKSRKRMSKTFQHWAGKRAKNVGDGKAFVIWGGKKRAGNFRTWAGKRTAKGMT